MKILIIGLNYSPEEIGIAKYTAGLSESLAQRGHDVHVIAGNPYYPYWKIFKGYSPFSLKRSNENGVQITRIPHYIPGQPTVIGRIIHYLSFAISAFGVSIYNALSQRPDAIVSIAPSLASSIVARFASILGRSTSWLHVQDFEIDAAVSADLMAKRPYLLTLLYWIERSIIRRFERVSSICPNMCQKLRDRGVQEDRVVEFRNWCDSGVLEFSGQPNSLKLDLDVPFKDVVLYSGSISNKQGIDVLLKSAELLRDRSDIGFLICGNGPGRESLEKRAARLKNVVFRDLQTPDKLAQLLALAKIHIVTQKVGMEGAVFPSKLGNILASGRPVIVTAGAHSALARAVEGCGVAARPGSALDIAEAIEGILADHERYLQLSANARERAEAEWSRDRNIDIFEGELERAVKMRRPRVRIPVRRLGFRERVAKRLGK